MLRRVLVRIGSTGRRLIPVRAPDFSRVQRICIFKIGSIGDVLMTTPMLNAIRQRFPKARIDYWTGRYSAEVLLGNRDLDEVVTFDEAAFNKKKLGMLRSLAKHVAARRYDLMFLPDKHWAMSIFGLWCRVPIRIGFDRGGENLGHTIAVNYWRVKHEVDYYLDLAYAAGAKRVPKPGLFLPLRKEHAGFAKAFFAKHKLVAGRTIAFAAGGARNPGQNMASRRWPTERFAEVARQMMKDGWQVLLIGKSPSDDEATNRMLAAVPGAVDATRSGMTIKQTAALIKKSRLLICNDTGPMHIAAAVGTPTVSVFGPTDPRRKAPRGDNHLWVWRPVECTRAEVYGVYDDPRIANNILKVQPKDVLAAARQLLKA
jgi:lipopolysaccharide heptosyltransferase II